MREQLSPASGLGRLILVVMAGLAMASTLAIGEVSGIVLGESGTNYVVFTAAGGWVANGDPQMITALQSISAGGNSLALVALGKVSTNWAVIYGTNGWSALGDTQMYNALTSINTQRLPIKSVSLGGTINDWAITYGTTGWTARTSDAQLTSQLNQISAAGQAISNIVLTDDATTWFVRYGSTGWAARGPTQFISDLNAISAGGSAVNFVTFSRNGQNWFISYGNGGYRSFTSTAMSNQLTSMKNQGYTINGVAMGSSDDTYVILYGKGGYFVHGPQTLLDALSTAAATAPQVTVQPVGVSVTAGQSATFTGGASGSPAPAYQWQRSTDSGTSWNNLADDTVFSGTSTVTMLVGNTTTAMNGHRFRFIATNSASSVTSTGAILTVNAPVGVPQISTQPQNQIVTAGGSATLTVAVTGTAPFSYQWRLNGAAISGATGTSLTVPNVQPANTGIYSTVITNATGSTTSDPAIVGVSTTSKVIGAGSEIAHGIFVASNGNTFDQVLPSGAAVTVTAEPGKITRTSFIDLTNDIVQVEFSGAGTLSLVLDNPTGPAAAANYNQPGVSYMKGHAGIVITGANETTNVAVFSVGSSTAVNQTLFKSGVAYDGLADLAYIAISTTDGKFGGVRTANGSYYATKGLTGLYAPGVQFTGPVYVGDINASGTASPVLMIGSASDARITGGDLLQANGQSVKVSGISQLNFTAGTTSQGTTLPAQTNKAQLLQNGVDVSAVITGGATLPGTGTGAGTVIGGKSIYEGTYIGQFNIQYTISAGFPETKPYPTTNNSKSFSVTLKFSSWITGVNDTDILNIVSVTASDPIFGAQFAVVPGAGSNATLPNPTQNVSMLGDGITIVFPNGTSLQTANEPGDMHVSTDGSIQSNSLDPNFPETWQVDDSMILHKADCYPLLAIPEASNPDLVVTVKRSTWALTRSAL